MLATSGFECTKNLARAIPASSALHSGPMPRPLGYTQAIKCPIVELIPATNVVEDEWTKKYVRTNEVVSKGLRKALE